MKHQIRLLICGLLTLYSATMPIQAIEQERTWQKKLMIAASMIASGIAGWLLLDYYLKSQFNNKLNEIVKNLVNNRGNAFFDKNGKLRQYPYLSAKQLENQALVDGQLYENARFGTMVTPIPEAADDIKYSLLFNYKFGTKINLSPCFNIDLLVYQIGSKICFLTSLLGAYYFTQPNKKEVNTPKTVQS
jgi:hypothetical protein